MAIHLTLTFNFCFSEFLRFQIVICKEMQFYYDRIPLQLHVLHNPESEKPLDHGTKQFKDWYDETHDVLATLKGAHGIQGEAERPLESRSLVP